MIGSLVERLKILPVFSSSQPNAAEWVPGLHSQISGFHSAEIIAHTFDCINPPPDCLLVTQTCRHLSTGRSKKR